MTRSPGLWRPSTRLPSLACMKASAINSKTHFSCFDSPAADERALREVFDRIASFTIGAEEEYFLVDPEIVRADSGRGVRSGTS